MRQCADGSVPTKNTAVSRRKLPVVRKMPRTKNIPQRNDGAGTREQQRTGAALAVAPAPAPAPHPNAPDSVRAGASGPSGVTLKLEEEQAKEEEVEEWGARRDGAAPGPARVPASGSRAAPAAAPAPVPDHDAPAAEGARVSGVTLVKEEESEETLGQQRDRLALALAHGPVRVDSHIKGEARAGRTRTRTGRRRAGRERAGRGTRERAGRGATGGRRRKRAGRGAGAARGGGAGPGGR